VACSAIFARTQLLSTVCVFQQDAPQGTVKQRMRGMHAVGMVVIIGHQVESNAFYNTNYLYVYQ
jgi:hypothetical protein